MSEQQDHQDDGNNELSFFGDRADFSEVGEHYANYLEFAGLRPLRELAQNSGGACELLRYYSFGSNKGHYFATLDLQRATIACTVMPDPWSSFGELSLQIYHQLGYGFPDMRGSGEGMMGATDLFIVRPYWEAAREARLAEMRQAIQHSEHALSDQVLDASREHLRAAETELRAGPPVQDPDEPQMARMGGGTQILEYIRTPEPLWREADGPPPFEAGARYINGGYLLYSNLDREILPLLDEIAGYYEGLFAETLGDVLRQVRPQFNPDDEPAYGRPAPHSPAHDAILKRHARFSTLTELATTPCPDCGAPLDFDLSVLDMMGEMRKLFINSRCTADPAHLGARSEEYRQPGWSGDVPTRLVDHDFQLLLRGGRLESAESLRMGSD